MSQVKLLSKNLRARFSSFIEDEEGITAMEYGLMAALVALAIVGTLGYMGTGLSNVFKDVSAYLK